MNKMLPASKLKVEELLLRSLIELDEYRTEPARRMAERQIAWFEHLLEIYG